jgi:hypothetical protein
LHRIEYQSNLPELRPLPQGGLEEAHWRIESLEAELAALRAQPRTVQTYEPHYTPVEQSAPAGASCGVSNPGFYAGAELPILKPHVDTILAGDSPFLDIGLAIRDIPQVRDFDYDASPRVWVGYVGCSGLGIRARWWQFDETEGTEGPIYDEFGNLIFDGRVDGGLELSATDFEVTDTICLGPTWQLLLSGGVRYAEFRFFGQIDGDLGGVGEGASGIEDYFDGIGATVAAELRRSLCWDLGLFASVRGSVLFGDEVFGVFDDFVVPLSFRFEESAIVRPVWEIQLGLDWSREICDGVHFVTRALGEVQYWDSIRDEYAIGLAGITLTAGFVR